ncbi:MAG: hypothetical protein AAFO82_14885, partial [Bacteroidota bacterium]
KNIVLISPYFLHLNLSFFSDQAVTDSSIMIQIQAIEKAKVEATDQHFQEIKLLLKPEQISDFQEFKQDALRRILFSKGKKTNRPKDF